MTETLCIVHVAGEPRETEQRCIRCCQVISEWMKGARNPKIFPPGDLVGETPFGKIDLKHAETRYMAQSCILEVE